jgi:glucuronoarabinoxylan endo-1,4-beta-xylanase
MRIPTVWWLVCAALVVAGCGGGGSGTQQQQKTTPTVTAWPTASAITYGQTLASSTLTGGTASVSGSFSWTTSTTAPGAGTPSEGVTFTPSDTTNYNTVAGSVGVMVNKATPTVSAWPTAGAITFGQTLASSTLSGGTASVPGTFSWTTSATAPGTGTASEGVTFTATDAADYNTVAGSVSVTVNKATPTVSAWPAASAITYGQTLASSTLSGGTASVSGLFTWTTSTTVPSAGTPSESVTFTPTDLTDYNAVTGSVSVTVSAAAPTVTAVTPTKGLTGVAITSAVTATFDQAMNSGTITASTFTLTGPGNTSVQGSVAYNAGNSVATFTPAANLAYSTTYVATLSTSITSSAGTALAANYTWSFTTTTPPVPTVTTTVPIDGATGVNISNALTATFSQPMNSSTITPTTFTLTGPGNTAVAGLITYNTGTSTATFTPNAALAYSTSYTGTITTGATSAAGATLASNYMWTFMTGASPNQVTVDFGKTYQTIRGFGGSTAWLGQLTTAQATALFNQSSGLGLSILRVRIDPEGASSSNWVTGEWTAELANAQEAMVANSNAIVIASPWTPPISMKNNSTSQPYINPCSPAANYCGGYLDPSHYADYVNYLEDFVTYFKNNGVNLYAISMQNEPDWNPPANPNSYEACLWTPAQMDTWVALLTSGGATYPFGTTKLIMPESLNFNPAQSNPTLADSSAAANVSIIAGHLYGASPSYATNAEAANKEVWMTEHATCESNCPAPSIADALASAEEVHNSMTVGYYNAYVWWWIWNDLNASPTLNYGLINSSTTSPAPTYYGAGVGQFSKFIQPGYVRVSATANPVSGVYVSAYSNSSPSHYVIVAINANTSTESLTFVLNNGTVTSVTPYETTSTAMITAQTAVSVSSGQFSYTLPAQSIVTFVQ